MHARSGKATTAALALVLATASGCGDSGGGFGEGRAPRLEVWHGERAVASGDEVALDGWTGQAGEVLATLAVENPGEADLVIRQASLEVEPSGALALRATPAPTADAPAVVCPAAEPGCGPWIVEVLAGPGAGETPPSGALVLRTNRTLEGATERRVPLRASAPGPRIEVLPEVVDAGVVSAGEAREREVRVLNTGAAPLTVHAVRLQGHPGWTVPLDGVPGGTLTSSQDDVALDPPLVVPPGASRTLYPRYVADAVQPAEATLLLRSDDPGAGEGTAVALLANTDAPCIVVAPAAVDFGGKKVGTVATVTVEVRSCGQAPLIVDDVHLADGGAGAFQVAVPDLPATLRPDDALELEVTFVPEALATLDGEGQPVPDEAALVVSSDAPVGPLEVPLRGVGVAEECPTAAIVVQEGEEVIPQTTLHLSGVQSIPVTEIVDYAWSVEQPDGSQEVLRPSAYVPEPTFEANVAGSYTFRLRVTDANGCTSPPAEHTVAVVADEAIHVELLWDTPADPDQTDEGVEAGADLDLHFVHPFATGVDIDGDGVGDGWFDTPFDCFWFNAHPNWASLDPAVPDDPGLDRDDTDGAGPENVNLDQPEDGLTYKVGVHYWSDHGWGPSRAIVRIYIFGTLVFEVSSVELQHGCLWYVADVHWPSGEVTLVTGEDGGYDVTCDVSPPGFAMP